MKRFAAVVAVLGLALAAAGSAYASLIHIPVSLDGTQEVPPTGSPGTGFANLDLDDVAETLNVDLSYSGLTAPATNAHIHCCAPPGVIGPVVIPFIPAGFITGSTSGTFSHLFALAPGQVAQIESGLSYINIHTADFPAGEIRGQIVVPEPETLALLAVAMTAFAIARRRRR
jgi:hypothetical protein